MDGIFVSKFNISSAKSAAWNQWRSSTAAIGSVLCKGGLPYVSLGTLAGPATGRPRRATGGRPGRGARSARPPTGSGGEPAGGRRDRRIPGPPALGRQGTRADGRFGKDFPARVGR